MRKILFAACGAVLLSQAACVSMSTLQTAETLQPEESQYTVGGGSYSSEALGTAVDKKATGDSLSLPYLEVSYRHGWMENLDWGAKLTLIGTATADVKYRLVDTEKFDFSVGAGLGYFSISSGSGDEKTTSRVIDFMVPTYLSYRIAPKFTPYLSPKLVVRSLSGETSGTSTLLGGAVGMKVGNISGVYLEYGFQKSLSTDFKASQVNVAWFWNN